MRTFINPSPQGIPDADIAALMEAERPHLLRYACYRLGNSDDAEDAVQELAQPRNYLYRSLSNVCTDRLRRLRSRQFIPIEQAAHLCEEQAESFEQEFRRISALLAAIPDEQAEVIRLRLHGGNSFADIADILELPVSTVKSRFQYGIEKIRKGLGPQSQTR